IWDFFGIYQTKKIRILHMLILLLVISQIIVSNWMMGTKSVVPPFFDMIYLFTWIHIFSGFVLLFLTFFLVLSCFKQRGLRYFYPYLWGDFKQIKEDIRYLLAKKLPDSAPKGLAATVQGLGLGALSIVILSGVAWFILWLQQSAFTLEARSIHKSLTILIEIYIYAHGT
ncbi:cytochrome b/b6 domain-containing protein, partial [Providencia rettgeri]|nr:cytochrome b/b6 domain-containing protein [Providencia rettgeri]